MSTASVSDMISRFRHGKPSSREDRERSRKDGSGPSKMLWEEDNTPPSRDALIDIDRDPFVNRDRDPFVDKDSYKPRVDDKEKDNSEYNPYLKTAPEDMPRSLDVKPVKQQKQYKSEALQNFRHPQDNMPPSRVPLSSSLELVSSRELR